MKNKNNNRLVYATDSGRICPKCQKYFEHCSCKQTKQQSAPPLKNDGIVRVSRETKGRKGKGVSIVSGVPLNDDELKKMARELKQKCGTGGTVKDGVIEIQGDHRETLVELLKDKGWNVKLAGG